MLCKGHCAGVEPAVDYFGNTVHGTAALRALHCDLVDIRTMQLYSQRLFVAGFFKQLLDGCRWIPYVRRSTPIRSEESPSNGFWKYPSPVRFPASRRNVLYRWIPESSLQYCYLRISSSRTAVMRDEPGFSCVVDQGRVASPAVRIAVLKLRSRKQQVRILQSLQDKGICFLYKYTRPGSFFGHIAFTVYQLYKRKIIFSGLRLHRLHRMQVRYEPRRYHLSG